MVESLPLALAFSAGVLATVNPCGFALLPSFIAYFLGADDPAFVQTSQARRALAGIGLGLALTLGFLTVFVSLGAVLSLSGQVLLPLLPWGTVGIGVVLIGVGIWVALGRSVPLPLPALAPSSPRRGLVPAVGFGMAYAVASLGCTLPIFLLVVGEALGATGPLAAVSRFAAYGLGMGLVLSAVTLATALLHGVIITQLRRLVPSVGQLSSALLIIAGVYLIVSELTSGILLS